ncbi:MAG: hypothetical protein ACRC6T_05760 [Sarcina sp.]
MKNLKVLVMVGIVTLSTSIFTACGGPKLSANAVATNFLTATFKKDLRVEENANEMLDYVHSSISNKEDALGYGVDFYDTIDDMVEDLTTDLKCDETLVNNFKDALINNITIAEGETVTEEDETKVSFDVTVHYFDLEGMTDTILEIAKETTDETKAVNKYLTTCTEEIASKKFPETEEVTVILEKDGTKFGITGVE